MDLKRLLEFSVSFKLGEWPSNDCRGRIIPITRNVCGKCSNILIGCDFNRFGGKGRPQIHELITRGTTIRQTLKNKTKKPMIG